MKGRFINRTIRHPRLWMTLILIFADLLGWILALTASWILGLFYESHQLDFHPEYLLAIILFFLLAGFRNLYRFVGMNPVDEMRRIFYVIGISIVLAIMVMLIFYEFTLREPVVFLSLWFFLNISILISRWALRIIASRMGVWEVPAVIIAASRQGARDFADYFEKRARLGIIPVLLSGVTESKNDPSPETGSIPFSDLPGLLDSEPDRFTAQGIYTGIVDLGARSFLLCPQARRKLSVLFERVIFLSDDDWLVGASQRGYDFEGLTGFEAKANLLNPSSSFFKRVIDVLGALILGLLSLPLVLLTMIAIKRSSDGPIFYTQERIGKDGLTIKILKFRTMIMDAERKLNKYLAENPAAKAEWDLTQKLRNDPRITKPGRWIRQFSLDELPQLINILKGEMSLVGPRPLPKYHFGKLSENGQKTRVSVTPGLTGLWQISGRSDNGIVDLEQLDSYYISHWSIWLDIYILAHTALVVLNRDGAY